MLNPRLLLLASAAFLAAVVFLLSRARLTSRPEDGLPASRIAYRAQSESGDVANGQAGAAGRQPTPILAAETAPDSPSVSSLEMAATGEESADAQTLHYLRMQAQRFADSAGAPDQRTHAEMLIAMSIAVFMDKAGTSVPMTTGSVPLESGKNAFMLNDRFYKFGVQEFPEYDQFLAYSKAVVEYDKKQLASPDATNSKPVMSQDLIALITLRAEEAMALLGH